MLKNSFLCFFRVYNSSGKAIASPGYHKWLAIHWNSCRFLTDVA